MKKILVVDENPKLAWLFKECFGSVYDLFFCQSADNTRILIRQHSFDLIFLDLHLSTQDGLEVLREIKKIDRYVPVIIMTAYASVQTAVEAMKNGAYDYITKPFRLEYIKGLMVKAINETYQAYSSETMNEFGIITMSKKMLDIGNLIKKVSPTNTSVLITGETGTGKELVAKAIHAQSPRKNGPIVALNCAAVPEPLLESELFGYDQGAFTGANKPKPGKIELANNGTLLLDELGDMPLSTQAKLLRVIEECEVERLGSNKKIPLDIRFIASTNKHLDKSIQSGLFREDLYFRLAVFPIYLPPLRQRTEDIPVLVNHFLRSYSQKYRKDICNIREDVLKCLKQYCWPGNIRELRNIVEQMVIMANANMITMGEVPVHIQKGVPISHDIPEDTELSLDFRELNLSAVSQQKVADKSYSLPDTVTLQKMKKKAELQTITIALENCNGNRTKAATLLGISRRCLQYKIKDLQMNNSPKENNFS